MAQTFSIGTLAKTCGVGVETIRYYERRRLLRQPPRAYGRIRQYGEAELERLRFIRRAQSAGFSLAEIEALVRFQHDQSCAETRRLVADKLASIEKRLGELHRLRDELVGWVTDCDARAEDEPCPALQALSAAE